MTALLEFDQVDACYHRLARKLPIFTDVTFVLPRGVSVGVLGGRGQGKSTLIDLATGATRPDRGQIRRRGRISCPVGYIGLVNGAFTVRDNIRVVAGFYGASVRDCTTFIAEVAGLGNVLDKRCSTLNSGQRSTLVYAMSYMIEFDCYVGDGLLFGGGGTFKPRCLEIVQERRRNAAFLFATGQPRDLRLFADVGAVIRNNRLEFFPTVEDAIQAFGELGDDAPEEPETKEAADEDESALPMF